MVHLHFPEKKGILEHRLVTYLFKLVIVITHKFTKSHTQKTTSHTFFSSKTMLYYPNKQLFFNKRLYIYTHSSDLELSCLIGLVNTLIRLYAELKQMTAYMSSYSINTLTSLVCNTCDWLLDHTVISESHVYSFHYIIWTSDYY